MICRVAILEIWAIAALAVCPSLAVAGAAGGLPPDAAKALSSPDSTILYSLEPTVRTNSAGGGLQGFAVLGKMALNRTEAALAIAAVEDAIHHPIMLDYHGRKEVVVAACFDPRHAIRVQSAGHKFDYLLCYSCGNLEVFRDNSLVSDLSAGGSPRVLNDLFIKKRLPLSKFSE